MAMSDSAYVAIGIACVVAALLIVVLIVYCVKHQHDKEDSRRRQEEMQRRERHRRHLMRTTIVRPPPYEHHRGHARFEPQHIPMSPPPAYKERATPYPPTHTTGIGGIAHPPPTYEPIPTVSRNVPPATTVYSHNDSYINNYYSHAHHPVVVTNSYNMNSNQVPGGPQLVTRPIGNQTGSSSIIVVNPATPNNDRAPSRTGTLGRASRMARNSDPTQPNIAIIDSRHMSRDVSTGRALAATEVGRANYLQDNSSANQSQNPFRQAVNRTQYYDPSSQSRSLQTSAVVPGQYSSLTRNNGAGTRIVEDLSLI